METGILSLLKGKNETENKLGNTLSLAWSFPHPFVGKAAWSALHMVTQHSIRSADWSFFT